MCKKTTRQRARRSKSQVSESNMTRTHKTSERGKRKDKTQREKERKM